MRKPISLAIAGLFVLTLASFSRPSNGNLEELTERIISLLRNYVEETPEEKVFLHMDKDYYAAGEDLWFSVYLTAGSPDVLSPLSKVVYVDLLDNKGKLISQKTVKMQEGHGFGDFKLDPFLAEGVYHIKAYSTWSKGFGEGQIFAKAIDVLDPLNMDFQPHADISLETENEKVNYKADISAVNSRLKPLSGNLSYEVLNRNGVLKTGEIELGEGGKAMLEFQLGLEDVKSPTFLKLTKVENEEFKIERQVRLGYPLEVVDMQFLPEGGELIAGLPNVVAFRAAYPDGTPAEVNGEITIGEENIPFATNVNGLGKVSLNPQPGKGMSSAIIKDDGKKVKVSMPEIKNKGINLTVDSRNPQLLSLLIQASNYGDIDPQMEGLLVVHARGRIGYMQKLDLRAGVTGARVPKNQLPSGINQVSVLSPEGVPLAERLVFVDFENVPEIEIEGSKMDFKGRGENSVKLKMNADVFEGGKYSVSITDASNPQLGGGSNILTYLKFASELKGNISDKDIYQDGRLDANAIDLILLTHGWRRFEWEAVFEQRLKNDGYIEEGINVIGTIKPKSKRALAGGTMNIFSRGEEEEFLMADFSETGQFIIDALDFQDTTTLVLTAEDGKHKKALDITVDPPVSKYENWEGFQPLLKSHIINPTFKDYLESADKQRKANFAFDDMDIMDLDEFVVQTRQIADEKDGITRMYGQGDKILKTADIPGVESYGTIFEMMMGRLPGVRIKPDIMSPVVTIRGQGSLSTLQPIFLLDNVQVDIDVINTINPRDVDTIEAFTDGASNAIFGSAGAGGVIAVYTKQGGNAYSPEEGVLHTKYPGYSTAREFYMPKYDEENSSKPDFRTTLYWNPLVSWNGNEAEIAFYNNDISDKFKVVVQGIDQFGRLSYAEKVID
ncbi:TonB-dependent receptor plug domain-containing protein [Litoribacter alkaliphilus]|uniref:TonB-dependent receptor plug domain-containing protein n=1 Tax=Litoribacter ruber TaxID=702568 RepID=A0AAP2CQA4_9BACT|nr:TonB-dependent receptor plug domain-containing protein [Litoribacter alkaliphilus]MBS9525957.1 TonB-dependent receptor plug domain-containing protein [Litoribacter alkaliphilus]